MASDVRRTSKRGLMTAPSATEAPRLAKAALADDDPQPERAPFHTDRTLKLELARFVEAVLSAGSHPLRVGIPVPCGPIVMSEHTPRMDGKHVLASLRADQARALAAALLRAADEAEGRK